MSKVIQSPSQRWSGSVTIADPMTMQHVEAFEAGLDIPQDATDGKVFLTVFDKAQIPAILACVEEWNLSNIPNPPTLDNFPLSPRKESHELIAWIFGEIRKVYLGAQEVPNE